MGVGVSWEESRLTGDPVVGLASLEGWGLGACSQLAPLAQQTRKDARGGQQGNEPEVQSLLLEPPSWASNLSSLVSAPAGRLRNCPAWGELRLLGSS